MSAWLRRTQRASGPVPVIADVSQKNMKTIIAVILTLALVCSASAMDQMTIGIFKVLDEPTPDTQEMILKHQDTSETLHVDRNTQLSDRDFKSLSLVDGYEISILITLTREGAKKLAALTKSSIGKRVAIVAHNQVLSAPVVQQEISGDSIQITGNLSKEVAKKIIALFQKAKNG